MIADLLRKTAEKFSDPEPGIPSGKSIVISEEDIADKQEHLEDAQHIEDTLNIALFITYQNAKRELSHRRVSVKKLYTSPYGNQMISAYCYEIKAIRSFRLSRIKEAIDLATNQRIVGQEYLLDHLGLNARYTTGDKKSNTAYALNECRHGLNVLIYLARCDDEFHDQEVNVIYRYVNENSFDPDFDEEFLHARIKGLFPDLDSFSESLSYLEVKHPKKLNKIAGYAVELVQADGKITKSEKDFLLELKKYLV